MDICLKYVGTFIVYLIYLTEVPFFISYKTFEDSKSVLTKFDS